MGGLVYPNCGQDPWGNQDERQWSCEEARPAYQSEGLGLEKRKAERETHT